LMEWQAWVRAQVPRYREVHGITFPGRAALYPGCQVHAHDFPLEKAGYRHGRFTPSELKSMARARAEALGLKDYDILTTQHLCTRYHQRFILPGKFDLLRKDPLVGRYRDVACHFRWVKKEGPDQTKNYPQELCDRVVAICQNRGYSVCCIGHPRYSYCPPGMEDLRTEDLEQSIAALCSVHLLVGELSGPLHLAQLCGVPLVTWADAQSQLDTGEYWNTFHVPTFIVTNATRRPEPEQVCETIDRAMEELRQRTDNFAKPSYTLPTS
jgi:ADP-heptose:LPS heptosyltransferase